MHRWKGRCWLRQLDLGVVHDEERDEDGENLKRDIRFSCAAKLPDNRRPYQRVGAYAEPN
ncbi:hypothetical protein PHLCEN_2v5123 [Hermanssonia centrifuga]|uniref:Uncharacterized protein n=1 Tax=Hermanssonia centrifuga TaxID=98765 RepID=A0A2R6PBT4_9APHY|nr:hypothetical protein PHLCEN_2v5123 [Hermanssonia centrifuga]